VENRKFLREKTSRQPIAAPHCGRHVLVPFAIEDSGRLGAHTQTLLKALTGATLAKGRTPPSDKKIKGRTPFDVGLLVGQTCATKAIMVVSLISVPPRE
jgi:hypothetical protein